MNIEHQTDEIRSVASNEGESLLTSEQKKLTQWHRIFGTEQELALTSVEIEVLQEVELMSYPPKADLLLLRNRHPAWTEAQRARLPDGIRDTKASRVLVEFKYTESTNVRAIRQAISYDHIYMETKLRANPEFEGVPEEALSTFLLSSKTPTESKLTELGFYLTDKAGVYQCDDLIKGRITVLSLNDLAREPHNALVKCFASKPKEQEAAFAMLRETDMMHISPELLWLLEGLEVTLVDKGGLKMPEKEATGEITADSLIEIGRKNFEKNLQFMPIEMLLDYVPAERILPHLRPEERIAGLRPEERIAGLRPEERIAGLRPEEVLGGFKLDERIAGLRPEEILGIFKPEELRQAPIYRQILTDNSEQAKMQEKQQILLRALRRKFADISDETVALIEETTDSEQLDNWIDQAIDAQILEDVEFS